jgi:predicted 2-oxoglutarate/Fe(II)-dependent dioxygenase YbiX
MQILTVDDIITPEESKELIETFFQDEPGIEYHTVDKCNESPVMKKILDKINHELVNYAQMIGLNRKLFYNNVATVLQDPNSEPGDTNSVHFDDSMSLEDGRLQISPSIVLVYFTGTGTHYEGGHLIFPFQNKIIEPKVGKLAIFPTGYLHSHKVLPFFGGDRYLIRIITLFDTNLDKVDSKRLADRLNIKQESKKL